MNLSVIVIVKDEADRITDCLSSVTDIADEIIILDSGSSDNTVEICKQFTEKVFETDWPGYGKQKQRALDKATGDWVLSIDADERLTPGLADEIDAVIKSDPEEVAFKMQWAVVAFGKQLIDQGLKSSGIALYQVEFLFLIFIFRTPYQPFQWSEN